jgi:CDGSH-type Zn-finger protein
MQMPLAKRLEPGKYYWCRCGKSATPPFCSGDHESSGILPLEFTVDVGSTKVICSCGLTENPPNCDGAHRDY